MSESPVDRPLRVTFIVPNAYPVLRPEAGGHFGGAETRAVTFARGLRDLGGFEITLLVDHPQAQASEVIEGLCVGGLQPKPWAGSWSDRVLTQTVMDVGRLKGFPWVRVNRLTPSLLWRVPVAALTAWRQSRRWARPIYRPEIDQTRPDVACAFILSRLAASVVHTATRGGYASAMFIAADPEVGPRSPGMEPPAGLADPALRDAGLVVVQSETQRRMLMERTGREGLLIRNPVDLTPITRRFPGLPFDRYALWVGRADRHHKRPLACVEAARAAPEVKIVMVMNPGKEAVSEEVRRGLPSNVHLIDRVDFQEIGPLYAGADLFLSTSVFEGVPNAVLMAGAQGVPVVSFEIDPGGVVAASGGGVVCGGEMGRFVRELRRLWADGEDRRRLGDLLREHVRREHDLQRQVETLAKALRELCAAQGPRPLGAVRPGA